MPQEACLHVGLAQHGDWTRACLADTRAHMAAAWPRAVALATHRCAGGFGMASRDDDRFRVKPAAPRLRGVASAPRFISQVLNEVSKAGAKRSSKQDCACPTSTPTLCATRSSAMPRDPTRVRALGAACDCASLFPTAFHAGQQL